MNKKLINVVKGDINTAIQNGNYTRNTDTLTNIEFNTPTKQILLDGVPYSNSPLTKVTWQELKDLRDNSELIPGNFYRITDYQCTTTQIGTRSAGHQFDIVLLALSENKLAEEGWAMMHDNIYDVTFSDGVTKKCYLNDINGEYAFIDVATLLACDGMANTEFTLDDVNKTATCLYNSTDLSTENFPYNYFQNSNLSAWKIWYCLDNDKSRFAWADDSAAPKYIKSSDILNGEILEFQGYLTYLGVTYIRYGTREQLDRYYKQSDPNNIGWILTIDGKVAHGTKDELEDAFNNEILDVIAIYYDDDSHGSIAFDESLRVTNLSNVYISYGRGVIYRMIDEWNNDCPYDFKNIQFKRALTDGEYDPDEGEDVWCYTFTWIDEDGEAVDASVFCQNIAGDEGFVYGVHDNSMLPCIEYDFHPEEHSDKLAFALNDNVFISSYQYEDGCFYGIYGNHFGTSCYSNTFGNNCYGNTFGNSCSSNTFGNGCNSNSFGNGCNRNTFGNECYNNSFGNYFQNNSFGNDCGFNKFGNYCNYNSFGNNCGDNSFGNECYNNSFGNYCSRNTFGNSCSSNTFGNNFLSSSIGANVNNIKVNKDYVQFILIENGNQFITITSTATTSDTFRLENFAIALGVNNGGSMKTISHNTTNDTFKTTYQNSNSTTKNV